MVSIKEVLCMYIYECKGWPKFIWNAEDIQAALSRVVFAQGKLLGKMGALGFDVKNEQVLSSVSDEIIKSSEIEGANLNLEQVRSSVARRLNISYKSSTEPSRYVDGVVRMMMDAIDNYDRPLTQERLFSWHAALFPTGWSGMSEIEVGKFRSDKFGRMQVVSERGNRKTIHYEAPKAEVIPDEVAKFLRWTYSVKPDLTAAAIAHLWFVTLHPFEDGNGRITRAITEYMLARCEKSQLRFYSMSKQIELNRRNYYDIIEHTQKGSLDITGWLIWFFDTLFDAISDADKMSERLMFKARFWQNLVDVDISAGQRKLINRLLDGFDGKMTSSRWANIRDCSQDTASREINDLIAKGVLLKEGVGRSTHYVINHDKIHLNE